MCFIESVSWAEILMPCFCPRSSETEATSLSIISSFVRVVEFWVYGERFLTCMSSVMRRRAPTPTPTARISPTARDYINRGWDFPFQKPKMAGSRLRDPRCADVVICVFGDAGKVCVDRRAESRRWDETCLWSFLSFYSRSRDDRENHCRNSGGLSRQDPC